MTRGKGWLVDPFDSRDRDAEGTLFAAGAATPREVNLYAATTAEPSLEAVQDQGATSSCVGFAAAQTLSLGLYLPTSRLYHPDPLAIYTNARRAPYVDQGCYPRLAAQGLREWGAPPAPAGGVKLSDVNKPIAWDVLQKGASARVKNFYKILGTGPALIEKLRRALAARHPFMFGQEVDKAFNDYTGGILGKFRGASLGGHMTTCYSYDADGNFGCKNQWGTSWGELGGALRKQRGYYRMSPERMMERHVTDFYAFDPALA